MSSKVQASIKLNPRPIIYESAEHGGDDANGDPNLLSAIESNIQESFDEIDILRGTIQYWESRRTATDPRERERLMEAFRIMHGELLGLTARMKGLLDRATLAPGV
jgi:hypothetical protein